MTQRKAILVTTYLFSAFFILAGCNSAERAASESQSQSATVNQDTESLYGKIQGSITLDDGTPMKGITVQLYSI